MNTINRDKNKLLGLICLLVIVSFLTFGCDTDETQTVANFTELVMSDEFDTDGAPNSSIWGFNIGTGENGWGNSELQYYTDRTENVTVQNGVLVITAKKEQFNGSSYTSARLLTKGKFEQTYGRFEARIRLPWGQGLWPAFWLLSANIEESPDYDPNTIPWPYCGEIDIMEYRGQNPTQVLGTLHGPGYSGGNSISKSYNLENDRFDTGFHVFGIEWGPEYINFYVDDVLYNQITPGELPSSTPPEDFCESFLATECEELRRLWNKWVFDQPFYIIINLAVGGNFLGSPNNETVFPQTMLVDYVRVYKNKYDNN